MAKTTQPRSKFAIAALFLMAAVLGVIPSAAQEVSEVQVKAAFLYNFVKFVEWPAGSFSSPDSPIVIGVVDDAALANALEGTVDGKLIAGRAIRVKQVGAGADLRYVHVLYISPSSDKRTSAFLAGLAGRSVLTVGDSEHFTQMGGIIRFFVQDARMRFEINPDAAERSHLKLSAKLLALARIVRGISAER